MIQFVKSTAENPDFIGLVSYLNSYLATTDGDEHSFYNQYNKLDQIKYVIIAYENTTALGCGAIKEYDQNSMEVKRMYVLPEKRGKKIASKILTALENLTKELTYKRCVLECGKRQPDAIACYKNNGYNIIPNYGQYQGMENSVCFEKVL